MPAVSVSVLKPVLDHPLSLSRPPVSLNTTSPQGVSQSPFNPFLSWHLADLWASTPHLGGIQALELKTGTAMCTSEMQAPLQRFIYLFGCEKVGPNY